MGGGGGWVGGGGGGGGGRVGGRGGGGGGGGGGGVERWRPMWGDAEYGYRIKHLRQRLASEPDKPLLVMLGSSRVGNGFEADDLPPPDATVANAPIVFNMSMAGGTHVVELFMLHRLLALGIHPRYVVIEVLAPALRADEDWFAPGVIPWEGRLRWSDLDVLRRHAPANAWKNYLAWIQMNLVPAYSYRYCLVSRYFPKLLEPSVFYSNNVNLIRHHLTLSGYSPFGVATVTPAMHQFLLGNMLTHYAPCFAQLVVSPKVDEVFRDMLELCRREQITVLGMVLMPESSEFRQLCTPAKRAMVQAYLTGLCRDYHIDLIDAGCWIGDEHFADGHHLLPAGAHLFTERLWREHLQPLLK